MLCYTVSRNFSTEKHPKLSEIRSGRKNSRAEENSQHLEQGNHCKDPKPLGGGGLPTSNKPETPKSVYNLSALQDGELSLS